MEKISAALVGNCGVGKTSIYKFYSENKIDKKYEPTIGTDFFSFCVSNVHVDLFDTAGDEKYRSLMPMYFRNKGLFILVFDLTEKSSFESIDEWEQLIRRHSKENSQIILVGNKVDLEEERVIDFKDADRKASQISALCYFETSAANGYGINELFEMSVNDRVPRESEIETIKPIENKKPRKSFC